MITQEQIEACRLILLKRQHELIEKLKKNNPMQSLESTTESVGELSSYDNHPADLGTENYERSKDLALKLRSETELDHINSALHAIEEGSYGICSTCGAPIPFERLLAVAHTVHCTEHAEGELDLKKRPIEEEVISPNITRPVEAAREELGYDEEDAWQDVSKYGTSETPSEFYADKDNYDEMYPNADELIGATEPIENQLYED